MLLFQNNPGRYSRRFLENRENEIVRNEILL